MLREPAMMLILFILLSTSPAAAQGACVTPPVITCPAGLRTCTRMQTCTDVNGCSHSQVVYQQDCTISPRPAYCPAGTSTAPTFVLRDRVTCP
jgi:hypothetical protein